MMEPTASDPNDVSPVSPGATRLAKPLAADDFRVGDDLIVLSHTAEFLSFFWDSDSNLLPPDSPVRVRLLPHPPQPPMQVVAVCLPMLLVKMACGEHRQIDVRQTACARVDRHYAKQARKSLAKKRARRSGRRKRR